MAVRTAVYILLDSVAFSSATASCTVADWQQKHSTGLDFKLPLAMVSLYSLSILWVVSTCKKHVKSEINVCE